MKMKKTILLLLVLLLGATMLSGCGKGATMDDAFKKYNLDPESTEWLDMSSERLPEADLLESYNKLKETPGYSAEYAEIVKIVGEEPSRYRYDGTYRIFEWRTAESDYRYIRMMFTERDGKWVNYIFSKTNM